MKNIEHKIDIAAKPTDIWNIIMDFEKYSEWNPMIIKLSGEPIVGQHLDASIKVGDRKPIAVKPRVLKHDKEKELRWVGNWMLDFLVRGEHYFYTEETPTGCTFYHGENLTGVFVGLVFKMMGDDLKQAYKDYNQALKHRAESASSS